MRYISCERQPSSKSIDARTPQPRSLGVRTREPRRDYFTSESPNASSPDWRPHRDDCGLVSFQMTPDGSGGVIVHAIQLAVAPVFLLSGIAALLGVMAGR